jgi:hypothetical protein
MARNLRGLLVWLPLAVLPAMLRGQAPNIIAGRPTDRSVTLSILMGQPAECIIDYGIAPGRYDSSSGPFPLQAGRPEERDLRNLLPDTRYWYRLRYRPLSAATYNVTPEYNLTTQRKPGRPFTFTLEADEHLYDKKGIRSMYQVVLQNQANDRPDFMISLGDTFGDDHLPFTITSAELAQLHLDYRPYLGAVCHSIPFYFCLGNHEGQNSYYLGLNPPNNLGVWGTLWRKYYYPNPFPDGFYTGNATQEPHGIGLPENYYAWTWGDALFVVLDVYRHQGNLDPKPQEWDWSLGRQQYDWLKNTLATSNARYKFVFAHHIRGQGRGGINASRLFEWGGYNADGRTYGFDTFRPGWGKPIHEMFREYGVNIYFQGHDHLFAQEVRDNVVYQAVPMAADSTYEIGMLANADAYVSNTLPGTGHLRVSVDPACVKVDFVRAWLPKDTSANRRNGEIAFSYSLGGCAVTSTDDDLRDEGSDIRIFPNPANDWIQAGWPRAARVTGMSLFDMQGRLLTEAQGDRMDLSRIPNGEYVLRLSQDGRSVNRKILIRK